MPNKQAGELQKLLDRESRAKRVCAQLNNFIELKPTLTTIIDQIKDLAECEAVSIRLHDDGDYPYYVYKGFPESFIKKENSLCSKDDHGNKIPLSDENLFELDCMCGNIIRGRFDSSLPFFTENGSFLSNNTTRLLESSSEEERQSTTRNYCNSCGYESVALVPIKIKNNRIGLIQLNDKRVDMFNDDLIEYVEMLGEQIGLAVDNSYSYQKISDQKKQLEETLGQLQTTQKQLVESKKMASLGNLIAGVAHEINTPVGVGITATSTLLQRNNDLNGLFRERKMKHSDLENFIQFTDKSVNLIFKSLRRTSDLIQNFKKVAVNQSTENSRKFLLRACLKDIVSSIWINLKEKNIKIEIDCDKDIELTSYPWVFTQIFTNLINNSVAHGFAERDQGLIIISAKIHDTRLHISYKDDGKGIFEEFLPLIYEPFFTTNKQIGSGLGMHIVYNLVTQKLEGTIDCENQKDKGVFFKIFIPLKMGAQNE